MCPFVSPAPPFLGVCRLADVKATSTHDAKPKKSSISCGEPWTNDWAAVTGAPHLPCFGGQHSSPQVSLVIQVVCHGHFPTVPIGRAETPACHCCSMPLQSTQLTKKHFGGKNSQAGLILYKHLSISEYRPLTYP